MANRIKGITVEIGGDTTKLQNALKGVNSSIKTTQAELKDVEKLLKLDPGNTELLAQKHRLLGDAVKETKEKLATLKTAAEQANEALAKGEISQSQYDALQREIIETEQQLKALAKQANESSVALQKIAATGEKLKSTGDTIASAGEKMLPVTAAITGLGTAAVTTAATFESSMSQVQATMGITKDAMSEVDGQSVNTMDTLSALAKKMGAETAFSASQCAEAINYLALAGYDTQQMVDTLPTVLNLAAAGSLDLASASDMVTDAMSALGMGVEQAGTMVDQTAKTASSTNTSVALLGEGILTIGATAKSVKGGTAELNTALGILANNGIKGAEGGTHLRNVILSLQSPTDKAAASMKELGVSVYDSEGNMRSLNDILGDLNTSMSGMTSADKQNIISTIFNKTDLASVNALLANTGDAWDELQSSIADSSGAAQQMADTQLDNLSGQLTILKSALEGLAISIGELLLPYIKAIVGGIQSFVDWLNSLDEGVKKVIVTVGLIAAAVGPVLIVIGKVMSSVGTIMTTIPKLVSMASTLASGIKALWAVLAANPVGVVIAAITALVAAFVYLWNTNEDFRNFWINLWETIKSTATSAAEAIRSFLASAWQTISVTAQTVWNNICTVISTAVTTLGSTISNVWNTIKNVVSTVVNAIYTTATGAFNNLLNGITGSISNVKNVIVSGFETAKSYITGLASQAFGWGKDIISGIVNGIRSMIGSVVSAVSNVANTIRSYLHFSVPDKGPLSDADEYRPDFMNLLASGIKKNAKLVVSAVTALTSAMSKRMTDSVDGMGNELGDAVRGIASDITSSIDSLSSSAEKAGRGIQSGLVNGMTGMQSKFREIWNEIEGTTSECRPIWEKELTAAAETVLGGSFDESAFSKEIQQMTLYSDRIEFSLLNGNRKSIIRQFSGRRGQNAFTNKVWCGSCGCKCERDNYGKRKRKIWCCSQPRTQCQMKRLPESELLEAAESLLGENFQAKVSADIDRVVVSDSQIDFEYKNRTVKTWQRK